MRPPINRNAPNLHVPCDFITGFVVLKITEEKPD